MPATIRFLLDPREIADVETLLLIGRRDRLGAQDVRSTLPASLGEGVWDAMLRGIEASDTAVLVGSYTAGTPRRVIAGVLPEACSRANSPSRAWTIPGIVRAAGKPGRLGVLFALDDVRHAFACALALASALPAWTGRSRRGEWEVRAAFLPSPTGPEALDALGVAAEAVRQAAALTDMPASVLGTEDLARIAVESARALEGVHVMVHRGPKLLEQGLGGIWAVGRGASAPPAMVVLDHKAAEGAERVAWIGKGVVFDTGGLCLKQRSSIAGMKSDMGGAAAVLAAFSAAVRLRAPCNLTAVLCIAENAIGPAAMRPDDIVTLCSGRSVEINNTDAEGRLLVADGLAWAARYREPDVLVDLATLTGSQPMATGRLHAAAWCNDEAYEHTVLRAGRASGDLVHPLPYAPEIFRPEFSSPVADMRNSPRSRGNARTACAAQFLGNHIPEFRGRWLHVDMAGPNVGAGRATGYGVGLLLTLAGVGAEI